MSLPIATQRLVWLGCLWALLASGCAAFRPVSGIPSRFLPDDVRLGCDSRSGKRTIDLKLLKQSTPSHYIIDAGDVLGVYIEEILGSRTQPPPVALTQGPDSPPSFGFPLPVRDDGTLSLPLVGAISVRGLTLVQAEQQIRNAYTRQREILKTGRERIIVTLQRPRMFRTLVIRQEATTGGNVPVIPGGLNQGVLKRGTGKVVTLPAYRNDVLNAIAESGGLPGLDAENAIYVIRARNFGPGAALRGYSRLDQNRHPESRLAATSAERVVIRGQSPDGRGPRRFDYSMRDWDQLERSTPRAPAGTPFAESARQPRGAQSPIQPVSWQPMAAQNHGPMGAGPAMVVPPRQPAPLLQQPAPLGQQPTVTGQPYSQPNSTAWPPAVPPAQDFGAAAVPGQDSALHPSWQTPSAGPTAGEWQGAPEQLPPSGLPQQPAMGAPSTGPLYGPPLTNPPTLPAQQGLPWPPQQGGYAVPPQGTPAHRFDPNQFPAEVQDYDPLQLNGQPYPLTTQPAGPAALPPLGPLPDFERIRDLGVEQTIDNPNNIRIPVRLGPGEQVQLSEQDVILEDGDIVFIESRETEVFYTGGLLGGGQFTLPRDYDLDILAAIAIAQSQASARSTGARNIGGVSALNNDVSVSASNAIILRPLPDGNQIAIKVDLYRAVRDPSERVIIQPGDYIMLQYTRGEAVLAFMERYLLEGAIFTVAAAQFNRNGGN